MSSHWEMGLREQKDFRKCKARQVSHINGSIAQLVERPAVNREVVGSSPTVPAKFK